MKLIGAPITTYLSFYRRAWRVDEAGPGDVSDGRRCISDRTFLHCMSGPELEHVRADAWAMRGTSLPCFFVEAMPHKSSKESRHLWRDNLSILPLLPLLSQIERCSGASRLYASRGAVPLRPALSHCAVRPLLSGRDIEGGTRLLSEAEGKAEECAPRTISSGGSSASCGHVCLCCRPVFLCFFSYIFLI